MSKRLFKLFSIYIYQTKFSFLFLFLQRHFYLSKRDYFVSSNTGPCIILNDWKIDEEVRQLAARQPLSMLRFSFLRIVRSTYDESRFDRIEKTTRLFERRSTTESPKSEKRKKGGRMMERWKKSGAGRKIGEKCVDGGRRKFSGCRKSFESRYPVGSKSRSTNEFCPCNLYRHNLSFRSLRSYRSVSFRFDNGSGL